MPGSHLTAFGYIFCIAEDVSDNCRKCELHESGKGINDSSSMPQPSQVCDGQAEWLSEVDKNPAVAGMKLDDYDGKKKGRHDTVQWCTSAISVSDIPKYPTLS